MADGRQLMKKASNSFEPQSTLSPMFQRRPFAAEPEEDLDDQEATPIQTRLDTFSAAPFEMAEMSLYPSGTPAYPVQRRSDEEGEFEEEPEDFTLQKRAFTSLLQRQEDDFEEEEESSPLKSSIQAKLTIGEPGDRYEQEADAMAAQVMKMPEPQTDEEDTPVQRRSQISSFVQRREDDDSDDGLAQLKPNIQAKGNQASAPNNFESRLAQKKGGGSPLPQETKGFMESRFGANFSGVRIHEAPKEASEIRAQAFTHGQDIYFNSGKYNPGSSSGKELLAHELTHTIQQTGPQVQQKGLASTVQSRCQECEKEEQISLKLDNQQLDSSKGSEDIEPVDLSTESESQQASKLQEKDHHVSDEHQEEGVAVVPTDEGAILNETGKKSEDVKTEGSPTATQIEENSAAADISLPPEASLEGQKSDSADEASQPSEETETQQNVPELKALQELGSSETEGTEQSIDGASASKGEASESGIANQETSNTDSTSSTPLNQTMTEVSQIAAQGIQFTLPDTNGSSTKDQANSIQRRADSSSGNDDLVLEHQRAEASNIASTFLLDASNRVQMVASISDSVPSRLEAAAATAKASVSSAIAQQQALVVNQISQQQSVARSQAQATIAQIEAQYNTTATAITQSTATARQTIEAEYTNATQLLDEKQTGQLARLDELYSQAFADYEAAGVKVGEEAKTQADQKADEYQSRVRNPKVDDSPLDGPVKDNKNEARAKAAREVGKQYKEALIEEAEKQATASQNGKPQDIEVINQLVTQSRSTLDTQYQQNLDSLASAETTALKQAQQAKASLVASTNQALNSTLQSLGQQQTSQQQLIAGYGQRQISAIEADAQKAIVSLGDGINQAATQLNNAIQDFQSQAQGIVSPDPDSLIPVVSDMLAQFDQAVAMTQTQTEQGITASEQGIFQGGEQALAAVNQLGQGGIQEAISTGQGLSNSLASLAQSVTTTFGQIQDAHNTTINNATESAKTGFTQVTDGIQTAFDTISQNIETGIAESVSQLETGLRGALSDLDAKIRDEAGKAADQVQPRWKTALKIILVIAVIVVVALVAGPAVIGAVGAAAGALGASAATASAIGAIVGGAIVGAASGAVIQMGNNVIDGKDLMEGVGQAAIVGAIGGALGGAGGVVGNFLGNAGKLGAGMTQSVAKFGIDAAFDIAGGLLGDLSVGNPITLEGVLIGAGIGAAVSISVTGLSSVGRVGSGMQNIQNRSFNRGAQFGRSVGIQVAHMGGIPIAGQRPGRPMTANYDPRGMTNNDLELRFRAGDQAALDELNYRELVYQRHHQVKHDQSIDLTHPGSSSPRGLGDFPVPSRKNVEASRRVLPYLEEAIGPISKKKSFAVNVTEVQNATGDSGFIVSLSGSPQKVESRLQRLQGITRELGGEFELGPPQASGYSSRKLEPSDFPGGLDCAEPKSFSHAGERTTDGTLTIWFGKKDAGHHEIPNLLGSDPGRHAQDGMGSHGMYMLPCPSCEINSAGMRRRTVFDQTN